MKAKKIRKLNNLRLKTIDKNFKSKERWNKKKVKYSEVSSFFESSDYCPY